MSTETERLQEQIAKMTSELSSCSLILQTLKTEFVILQDSVKKLSSGSFQSTLATQTTPTTTSSVQTMRDEDFRNYIKSVVQKNYGSLNQDFWLAPSKAPILKEPQFIPIAKRNSRTRFLSFINFKGGVGKTTITSNLSAAFASGNYKTPLGKLGDQLRVLVVDLDFQGTLSDRCVPLNYLQEALLTKKTSVHLLENKGNSKYTLDEITVPFINNSKANVIPANALLDYADNQILNYQFFEVCESRFNYRSWFHSQEVFDAYDIVLFDCPPRKTASSVCALAASDYVFIPTAPEKYDINSVERCVQWLVKFSYSLNLPLEIGGIVFNRTNSETKLSEIERNFKSLLEGMMQDMFIRGPRAPESNYLRNHPLPSILSSFIPKRSGKDSINGEPGYSLPGSSVKNKFFTNLATEIYQRIY